MDCVFACTVGLCFFCISIAVINLLTFFHIICVYCSYRRVKLVQLRISWFHCQYILHVNICLLTSAQLVDQLVDHFKGWQINVPHTGRSWTTNGFRFYWFRFCAYGNTQKMARHGKHISTML